jgi:hypothetical protein
VERKTEVRREERDYQRESEEDELSFAPFVAQERYRREAEVAERRMKD